MSQNLNNMYIPLYNPNVFPVNNTGGTGMLNTLMLRNAPHHRGMFLPKVLQRFPYGTVKMTALIELAGSSDVNSNTFAQRIKTTYYPTLQLLEDMPPTSQRQVTTIKVDSTKHLLPNETFVVMPFGEMIEIVQVTGDHTVNVMRGVGSVAAFGAKKGSNLQFAGNAFREASLRPLGKFREESELWFHTQIFRDGWAVTNTEHEVAKGNGYNITANSKEEAAVAHATAIEYAAMFGQIGFRMEAGQPKRTMGGLMDIIKHNAPQNFITTTGNLSYFDLVDLFDGFGDVQVSSMSSPKRIIYGDATFFNTINEIGLKYQQRVAFSNNNSDVFGQRFSKFITPRMEFEVHQHPIFSRLNLPAGMGFIVDPTSMKLHYLRRTFVTYFNATANGTVETFTSDNGIDARGGDFLTELGLSCENPSANGVIFGFTSGACTNEC